jgi:hypothetical protein
MPRISNILHVLNLGLILELVPVGAYEWDLPRLDSIIYRLSSSRSRLGTSAGLLATGICASFRLENLDSAEP